MSQVYQTRIRRTDGEEYWGFGKERTPHIAVRTELGVDPVSFFAGFNEGLQELGEELIDFELLPDLKVFKTRLLMQNSNEKYTVDSEVYAPDLASANQQMKSWQDYQRKRGDVVRTLNWEVVE